MNDNQTASNNILDTIIGSKAQSSLNNFEPAVLVKNLLAGLRERDREILDQRFGLSGENQTLEAIGKKFNLTRERVRQIEKDSIRQIKSKKSQDLEKNLLIIYDTIAEHGGAVSEDHLLSIMLPGSQTSGEASALKFLLFLGEQFKYMKETKDYDAAWAVVGFNYERLDAVISELVSILKSKGKVTAQQELRKIF